MRLGKPDGVDFDGASWSQSGDRILTNARGDASRMWLTDMADLVDAACHYAARNMTWSEWRLFMNGPYRPTCDNLPVPPDVIEGLVSERAHVIRTGGTITDVAPLATVLALPPVSAPNPEAAAWRYLLQGLTKESSSLTQPDRFAEVLAVYTRAEQLNPELGLTAAEWNGLCWYGSLAGSAARVLGTCDRAVALAGKEWNKIDYRESRGLARALTSDINGAIEDFEAYVAYYLDPHKSWGTYERAKVIATWIEALKTGQNPFSREVLEGLKRSN